jgi:hypothetical protein
MTETRNPNLTKKSAEVADDVAAFIAAGGVIQQAGNTQLKDLQPMQDGRKQITLMSKAKRKELLQ